MHKYTEYNTLAFSSFINLRKLQISNINDAILLDLNDIFWRVILACTKIVNQLKKSSSVPFAQTDMEDMNHQNIVSFLQLWKKKKAYRTASLMKCTIILKSSNFVQNFISCTDSTDYFTSRNQIWNDWVGYSTQSNFWAHVKFRLNLKIMSEYVDRL